MIRQFGEEYLSVRMGKATGMVEGYVPPLRRFINEHTRAEGVVAEGMTGTDFPKEGRVERLQEGFFLDIVRGEVAKDAWFDIAAGGDVQVLPPSGDTAVGQVSVVPEVDKEHRLGGAEVFKPLPHIIALFRGGHQLRIRHLSDRYIVKVPHQDAPLLNEEINELIARQDLGIFPGLGGGYGEEGEGSGTLNSDADATATVGDTTATGGNATIEEGANTNNNTNTAVGGEGGNATIEGGAVVVENNVTIEGGVSVPSANSQTVEGDDVDIQVDARTINEASTVKPAVNSVAPSFSGICNSGAAGQSRGFALSLAVTNDVCQALMIADAYMALGDVEEAHKWVRAAARHAGWKGGLGYIRHLVTLGIL